MKMPFRHAYDFVFGLGQNCANADYLSSWGLRTCSSPFDWLEGSHVGLANCVDLICRDFEGFILKENLRPNPDPLDEKTDSATDYYTDAGTGFVVMHDFPRGVPLGVSYPQVMAKYRRRIDRLYARVSSSRRTLFVYWARYESVSDDALAALLRRLREKFVGSAVDLLVIEHDGGVTGIARADEVADGAYRIVGRFFVPRTDNLVMGDEKLNGLVYGAIPKRPSLWLAGRRQKAKNALIRALSLFCPGRARRKAFRKRMMRRCLGREFG